jgi:hypothetical protein
VLRISTPDLDTVRSLADNVDDPDVAEYVRWSNQTFGSIDEQKDLGNPTYVVNRLMRAWGHTFLYDYRTLNKLLLESGFSSIARLSPGESRHQYLLGVDRHSEEIGSRWNELESLVVEATA